MSEFPTVERDEASAAFFDAAAHGELLMCRCVDCGLILGPQARTCPVSGSVDLEPVVVSGRGSLVSWAVVHQAPLPLLADAVPYTTAVVELDEGPWLMVRVVEADPGDLREGTPLSVRFVPAGAETVPVFAPTSG